jgi:hypothetical protein
MKRRRKRQGRERRGWVSAFIRGPVVYCCLLWWPGDFIAKEDEEDEEGNEWPEFAQHDGLETAAQLEEIASEYKARAAKDYRLEPSADDDNVDPTILKMRDEVHVNRRNLGLWSFKVPMSV